MAERTFLRLEFADAAFQQGIQPPEGNVFKTGRGGQVRAAASICTETTDDSGGGAPPVVQCSPWDTALRLDIVQGPTPGLDLGLQRNANERRLGIGLEAGVNPTKSLDQPRIHLWSNGPEISFRLPGHMAVVMTDSDAGGRTALQLGEGFEIRGHWGPLFGGVGVGLTYDIPISESPLLKDAPRVGIMIYITPFTGYEAEPTGRDRPGAMDRVDRAGLAVVAFALYAGYFHEATDVMAVPGKRGQGVGLAALSGVTAIPHYWIRHEIAAEQSVRGSGPPIELIGALIADIVGGVMCAKAFDGGLPVDERRMEMAMCSQAVVNAPTEIIAGISRAAGSDWYKENHALVEAIVGALALAGGVALYVRERDAASSRPRTPSDLRVLPGTPYTEVAGMDGGGGVGLAGLSVGLGGGAAFTATGLAAGVQKFVEWIAK